LKNPLELTYTEEYNKIYTSYNRFLIKLGVPLYNMWDTGRRGQAGRWMAGSRTLTGKKHDKAGLEK